MPSTAIRKVSYVRDTRELHVGFVGGGDYVYLDVPAEVYQAYLAAISKGTFVNQVVKAHFAFRRAEPGDAARRTEIPDVGTEI